MGFSARKNNIDESPAGPQQHDQAEQRTIRSPPADLLTECPQEVSLRILGFLSAEDLAVICRCSRHWRAVSATPVLWRRLYCSRCGGAGQGDRLAQPGNGPSMRYCAHPMQACCQELCAASLVSVA